LYLILKHVKHLKYFSFVFSDSILTVLLDYYKIILKDTIFIKKYDLVNMFDLWKEYPEDDKNLLKKKKIFMKT